MLLECVELFVPEVPIAREPSVELFEAGYSQLVVDLSLTTFMDSTAIGVLIALNRSLDVGSRLAIACAQPNVLRIFELSGMDDVLASFSTLDEALAYVQGQDARAG